MKAILVQRHGGPEVLELVRMPQPVPDPTEVLVRVAAAGVNFIDIHHRAGRYHTKPPFVPGLEGAGTVVAVGAEVRDISVGQQVGWINVQGAYAEQAVVPAERVIPLPESLPARRAAAVLLQGMTAHYLAFDIGGFEAGEAVLVHAAAGGLGQLLVQLLKRRGAVVIGTVSIPDKIDVAKSAGVDHVLLTDPDRLVSRIRRIVDGVAAVFDGVGAPTFEAGLAVLRPRGFFVLYGQAGGRVPPLELERINTGGSLFITRPNLEHYLGGRQQLLARAREVFRLVADGELVVHRGGDWPLEKAAAAHAELESRRSVGKLVLDCNE